MRSKNTSALTATVITAILALAMLVVALVLITKDAGNEPQPYKASDELKAEMEDAAGNLLKNNLSIYQIYYVHGLPHLDEPYGNRPEDGYYTVDSETFSTYEALLTLVRETYVDQEAKRFESFTVSDTKLFITKENGKFGISEHFTPMEYKKDWSHVSYVVKPKSDYTCDLAITLNSGETVEGAMLKTNGVWRLETVIQ